MKEKTIIHQRIPNNGGSMAISQKDAWDLHKELKAALPEAYIVISTPTDISVIAGDAKIIQIDAKKYSYNELKDIIDSQDKV